MKEHLLKILALMLVLGVACVGCLNDDDDDNGTTPTIPTVTFCNIEDGATVYSLFPDIVIRFSEAMNETSVEDAFLLDDGERNAVDVTFEWQGLNLAVWTQSTLEHDHDYTMTIGTDAESEAGENLAEVWTVDFTTYPSTPVVMSTLPADGATDVGLNAQAVVMFSMDMDTLSVQLALGITPTVPYTSYIPNNGTELTITFGDGLAADTEYTVTIAGTAASEDHTAMGTDYAFSFTTGDTVDETPPTILSYSPADGATGVSRDIGFVQITFSEPIRTEDFIIFDNEWDTPRDYRWLRLVAADETFSNNNTVWTAPLFSLPPGITLYFDPYPFADMAGNASADPPPYSFTVAGTPEWQPHGANDWWVYINVDLNDVTPRDAWPTFYRVENVSGGDFDIARYEMSNDRLADPDREDPSGEFTELDEIWHYRIVSGDLYALGWTQIMGETENPILFSEPVPWLKQPPIVSDTWNAKVTATVGEDAMRITADFEILPKEDFEGPMNVGPRSVWGAADRADHSLMAFPDCAVVEMTYLMERWDGEDWIDWSQGVRTTWYSDGVGVLAVREIATLEYGAPADTDDYQYLYGPDTYSTYE